MAEFVRVFESYFLYEVEIIKSKLAANEIDGYIKNSLINNVVLMPINQFYILYVNEKDAEMAYRIIDNAED